MTDPRPGVKHKANRRRPHYIGVWLTEPGARAIKDRAEAETTSTSELIRQMLAYAILKMPKGWKP